MIEPQSEFKRTKRTMWTRRLIPATVQAPGPHLGPGMVHTAALQEVPVFIGLVRLVRTKAAYPPNVATGQGVGHDQ
jgi:hypothetical protein